MLTYGKCGANLSHAGTRSFYRPSLGRPGPVGPRRPRGAGCCSTRAAKVRLSKNLKTLTAGIRVLPDGSIAAISSGLLSGKAALLAGKPDDGFTLRPVNVR